MVRVGERLALVNIGFETEQIEYKKSIGELKGTSTRRGELYFGVKNDGTVIEQEINDESLR